MGRELEVDDRGVESHDSHTCIFSVEVDGNKGREPLQRFVNLVEFGLYALEFIGILAHLFFHNLS